MNPPPSASPGPNKDQAAPRGWSCDLLASVVVFLVALPLCMGIAVASGAPVASGLISGMVGGLVTGPLAGSPLQVSGPAAGLTVVVFDVIEQLGLPALGLVVLLAGALQALAGWLRWGQFFRAVSPAVIHGMLAGIGVLIFASQFHVMVDDKPRSNGLTNLVTIPEAVRKGLPLPAWGDAEQRAAARRLLQQIGGVHERQVEIQRGVGDLVSVTGSDEEHARQVARLAPWLKRQEQTREELDQLAQNCREADLASVDREALDAALTAAEAKLAAAEADLRVHRLAELDESQQQAADAIAAVLAQLKNHDWAAKIGLLTIGLIVAWQTLTPKRVQLIPGPLVAILAATAFAALAGLPVLYVEAPQRITDGVNVPTLATLNDVPWRQLLSTALLMAAIASAETLLCATAVDQMHTGPRTRYDQELVAQGIGNMVCGLLGALPITGVIVRSAANVQAGAASRLSAILHGVWLLLFVGLLGHWLQHIPTAALAGILVYTGARLVRPRQILELWQVSKTEALIFIVTVTVIVVEDLLTGVLLGVGLSAIKLLWLFSQLETRLHLSHAGERAELRLAGAATFIRLPQLASKLEEVPAGAQLHVDLEQLDYIDHACLDLLMNWARQHEATGGRLIIDWGSLHARFSQARLGNHPPRGERSNGVGSAA